MTQEIQVMNANAIKLALQYFNDATAFIQIMEANHLSDWVINRPVITPTTAANVVGDTILVLQPTDGIEIGMVCYCAGLNTFAYVLNVQNMYSDPGGLPFSECPTPLYLDPGMSAPTRQFPPTGTWLSTNVTLSAGLDNAMASGTEITFAIAAPTTITIPDTPPTGTRGIPT